MALIVKYGTDAQRQNLLLELGRPFFTTDTQQFYMGNGVTMGGVYAGGGVNLTVASAPTVTKTLSRVTSGDKNGLFYYLRQSSSDVALDPLNSGRINCISSGALAGGVLNNLFDRGAYHASGTISGYTRSILTSNVAGNWVAFDLGAGTSIRLTNYTLQNGLYDAGHLMRNWKLQGSLNAGLLPFDLTNIPSMTWVDLDTRVNDTTLTSVAQWVNFIPSVTSTAYRFFRLLSTGASANGQQYFQLGQIELYGETTVTLQLPLGFTGWLQTPGGLYLPYA